jgi:hypothetical protein
VKSTAGRATRNTPPTTPSVNAGAYSQYVERSAEIVPYNNEAVWALCLVEDATLDPAVRAQSFRREAYTDPATGEVLPHGAPCVATQGRGFDEQPVAYGGKRVVLALRYWGDGHRARAQRTCTQWLLRAEWAR